MRNDSDSSHLDSYLFVVENSDERLSERFNESGPSFLEVTDTRKTTRLQTFVGLFQAKAKDQHDVALRKVDVQQHQSAQTQRCHRQHAVVLVCVFVRCGPPFDPTVALLCLFLVFFAPLFVIDKRFVSVV